MFSSNFKLDVSFSEFSVIVSALKSRSREIDTITFVTGFANKDEAPVLYDSYKKEQEEIESMLEVYEQMYKAKLNEAKKIAGIL